MAWVAHPDVGEGSGADRAGDHHRREDDACPFLVAHVDCDLSPSRQAKEPGGSEAVQDQRADQGADRDPDAELLEVSHYEGRQVDHKDADRRDDADHEQQHAAAEVAAEQPITLLLVPHQVTASLVLYSGRSQVREVSTSRSPCTASNTST